MSDLNTSNDAASPAGRRGVIDQFEGDLATIVFDDNQQIVVARRTLPPNSRVGDVVFVDARPKTTIGAQAAGAEASAPTVEVDATETEAAKERVRNLLDDIFKKK